MEEFVFLPQTDVLPVGIFSLGVAHVVKKLLFRGLPGCFLDGSCGKIVGRRLMCVCVCVCEREREREKEREREREREK